MDVKEAYLKAGKISAQAREKGKQLAKPGKSALEIADEVEKFIQKQGAQPAFPATISLNEDAAHYAPKKDDPLTLPEKGVVKVDVGAHINGYIGDTAVTIDLSGENSKLLEASEKALENAIATAKAGVTLSKLGTVIQETIESYGLRPVSNLSGHLLGQYKLHAGLSIPNIKNNSPTKLQEGMAVAIEPFATTGEGTVKEGSSTEIFQLQALAPTRNKHARKILEIVQEKYMTLPFAERWLYQDGLNKLQVRVGLRELVQNGSLNAYPVLHDVSGSLVSQKEHTLIIEKDSCKITTRVKK